MEDNYEIIVRGDGWRHTVRLQRLALTRIGESEVDRERLVMYGTQGYMLDRVWEHNLLEPISDPQVVEVLQYELDAAMELARQERFAGIGSI
jgi:hypothetical protein